MPRSPNELYVCPLCEGRKGIDTKRFDEWDEMQRNAWKNHHSDRNQPTGNGNNHFSEFWIHPDSGTVNEAHEKPVDMEGWIRVREVSCA